MTAPAKTLPVPLPKDLVSRIDEEADKRILGRRLLVQLVLEHWLDEVADQPLVGPTGRRTP